MKYKLIPYLMYKNDEITVIQNEKTTCIITDTNLTDFLLGMMSIIILPLSLKTLKNDTAIMRTPVWIFY